MSPSQCEQALKAYDDQLRLKRGVRYHPYEISGGDMLTIPEEHWRVERRVQGPIIVDDKPDDIGWSDWHEHQDPNDRYSAQEKYLLVFVFWPNQMDNRVMYTLMMLDMQHKKHDKRVQEQIERIKRKKQKANEAFGDMVGYEAKQWYKYINTVRTLTDRDRHTAPRGGMSIMGGY